MPHRRPAPETRGKPFEEGLGQRNLGHQDQRLSSRAQRLRHRLEIHFGLPRTRHTIEQERIEIAILYRLNQCRRCSRLSLRQRGPERLGVGQRKGRFCGTFVTFQRSRLDQPADYRIANLRLFGQFAHRSAIIADCFDRLGTPRRHSLGKRPSRAIFDDRPTSPRQRSMRQYHA